MRTPRYPGGAIAAIAAGESDTKTLELVHDGLICGLAAVGVLDGVLTPSVVGVRFKIDQSESAVTGEEAWIPGQALLGPNGIVRLLDPVALHTKQTVQLEIKNFTDAALDTQIIAEVFDMEPAEVDRYNSDPSYRSEIRAAIALWSNR